MIENTQPKSDEVDFYEADDINNEPVITDTFENVSDNDDLIDFEEAEDEIFEIPVSDSFLEEIVFQTEAVTSWYDEYYVETKSMTDIELHESRSSFFKDGSIILYLAFLFLIVLLVISMAINMRKNFKLKALNCIIKAEEKFIHKKRYGKVKRLYAVHAFINLIPALLRPFLNVRFAEKMIDLRFAEVNKFAELRTGIEPSIKTQNDIIDVNTEPDKNNKNIYTLKNSFINEQKPNEKVSVNLLVEYPNGVYIHEYKPETDKQGIPVIDKENEHNYIFKRNREQKGNEKLWITIF